MGADEIKNILCLAALFVPLSALAQGEVSEEKAIEYAKRLSPSILDSKLPKGNLSEWLTRTLGKNTMIKWELNDCGEQTGDPKIDSQRDLPVCVGIYADLANGRKVGILVVVGTIDKGLVDPPAVYDLYFEFHGQTQTLKRLSDLKNAVRRSPR